MPASLSTNSVEPITKAEVSAPTTIANCCRIGVAPTRKPVFRSWAVVPPFEAATQTTPATVTADKHRRLVDVARPATNARQVNSSVATVMPEIGFDDEPISPVNRDETATNKKPKHHDQRGAPAGRTSESRSPIAAPP